MALESDSEEPPLQHTTLTPLALQWGYTPVHTAAENRKMGVVRLLLDQGVNKDAANRVGAVVARDGLRASSHAVALGSVGVIWLASMCDRMMCSMPQLGRGCGREVDHEALTCHLFHSCSGGTRFCT